MIFKYCLLFACVVMVYSQDESSSNNTEVRLIRFSKEARNNYVDSFYYCIPSDKFAQVPCLMSITSAGKYRYDDFFKNLIFCTYYRAGYADKNTGQINVQKYAAEFPKDCNMLPIIEKCSKFITSNAVDTFMGYHVCVQNTATCQPNFLPLDM